MPPSTLRRRPAKNTKPTKSAKSAKAAKPAKAMKSAKASKPARSAAKGVRGSATSAGKSAKMVFYFGRTKCEGKADQKLLLGGKGANLSDMVSIGLPVPPGFTITTDTCARYYTEGRRLPKGLMDEVRGHIATLEKELGKKLGDMRN
ncbi:MAG: PEP/pyruvate-binding domain-containing protein, partial [Bacteroidia bacterium]|nr:PEP/pyruvate-binding domain-containing protein [Bacteroidia bacterium]